MSKRTRLTTTLRVAVLPVVLLTSAIAFLKWQTPHASPSALTGSVKPAAALNNHYSPYADPLHPTRVYWGETHLHTAFSPDAGLVGDHLEPDSALRLVRGEQIRTSTGQPLRLEAPYDWIVITDHAEYMGLPQAFKANDENILKTESGKKWAAALKQGGQAGYQAFVEMTAEFASAKPSIPRDALLPLYRRIWKQSIDAAERNTTPGVFTVLSGFEWTQSVKGNNLHRSVVFRDGPERTGQVVPFSEFDSVDPEDLWKYMADYEAKTGGRVLAIEHNPNLSGGLMFAPKTWSGKPFDAAYASLRARFEPLVETSQSKGDSETSPELSSDDPFANFERWNKTNIFGMNRTTPEMLPYSYVRSALKLGLQHQTKLGVNPFKFGMIGASDEHTSLSTTRAENYFGVGSIAEPKPDRWKEYFLKSPLSPDLDTYMWEMAPGGLTGVWARENTREAIWDALYRREVFTTSGTRPTLRVFGGWDFSPKDLDRPEWEWVENGYAHGVPMGADLASPPSGKAPTFLIKAQYDPAGAYLDRVQIIKGWLDGKGETHEKIIDVAWSGARKPDANGRVASVGSTVDGQNATWTNSIGAPVLAGFWRDPEFDPTQLTFYYVRVLEIPTPRWTAYDVKRFGVKMDAKVPMVVTNRAYSSPIWYSPTK